MHCSVVESMITQSPLFHGPRMVEQLTFFSVQILFLRYIHFMILNLFIAKQWKDVWPNLRSNCLIWKSQRYWLVIWCQNYVHEKLNYITFLGELFAVGSYNTLRLCDTAGVSVWNVQHLITACYVSNYYLGKLLVKIENQPEWSFGMFFFAVQHHKKMSKVIYQWQDWVNLF